MLKVAIVGLGSRGRNFANKLAEMDDVKLIAVAETVEESRKQALNYGVEPSMIFNSADEFFAQGKICDAIFICTQDNQHKEMALKALELGYDICLEKPAAANIEDCILIRDTANKLGRKVMLTHVLRYAPIYRCIKEVISSGELGEIVNINQTENIAYWHFALSYVRGPWRSMSDSTPTIIAKCCHDLDIIKWLMDEKCTAVSSFGNLYYFNKKHAPKGSARHCADCAEETKKNCPYNAYVVYPEHMKKSVVGGTAKFAGKDIFQVLDEKEEIISRCVFHADNDAVDNQVVNMIFESGATANLTMIAYSEDCHRIIAVHGTKGELYADAEDTKIHVNIFGKERKVIDVDELYNSANIALNDGHGGGDYYLTRDFINYVTVNSPSVTRTTIDDSIESHVMGFKAEESRLAGGKVISI